MRIAASAINVVVHPPLRASAMTNALARLDRPLLVQTANKRDQERAAAICRSVRVRVSAATRSRRVAKLDRRRRNGVDRVVRHTLRFHGVARNTRAIGVRRRAARSIVGRSGRVPSAEALIVEARGVLLHAGGDTRPRAVPLVADPNMAWDSNPKDADLPATASAG
jgi:hypothetical protein